MTNQRYSTEFKDEAVRQVVDRRVSGVETLWVFAISRETLWVSAISPAISPLSPIFSRWSILFLIGLKKAGK